MEPSLSKKFCAIVSDKDQSISTIIALPEKESPPKETLWGFSDKCPHCKTILNHTHTFAPGCVPKSITTRNNHLEYYHEKKHLQCQYCYEPDAKLVAHGQRCH